MVETLILLGGVKPTLRRATALKRICDRQGVQNAY